MCLFRAVVASSHYLIVLWDHQSYVSAARGRVLRACYNFRITASMKAEYVMISALSSAIRGTR
jgi:hypothetical protein